MADKIYRITFEMDDGTEKSVEFTAPQGEPGAKGNGIKNAVLNADYTLKLTFDDGTSYTTPSIRGATGATGSAGSNGSDGVSPTVAVSKTGKVTTISITDKSGTKTATINDGADGSPGATGTSVTVKSVSESSTDGGSNVVTFSDGKTVTIKNGKTGANGKDGTDATVTKEVILERLGYTPANVEDVFDSALQPTFTNVFDTVAIEYGKIVNSDGTIGDTAAALATTDFIPIKTGDVIRMADFALYKEGSVRIGIYRADKSFMSSVNATAISVGNYYLPNGVFDDAGNVIGFSVDHMASGGFIRICTKPAVIGSNPVLTINEEIAYEVGYGTKLNPKVKVPYSQITDSPQKNGWNILPYEHLNIAYSSIGRKPINTVEHFTDAATNFGYNCLKADIRPTSDGELVCCHDAGFTFDSSGYITTYNASNSTVIHNVTAATVLGYSFPTGEHPCLVGDYLDVCRKYGKVAFVTIRNEYMDVVIPKLLAELKAHNMTHATIINCMTYESLVQWRTYDSDVMINYTLANGVPITSAYIDKAIGLGYCSICGFSLSSASTEPSASCDFEYARENGIRLLQAIAYKEGSPEACYDLGYDGCQIGIAWNPITPGGITEEEVDDKIAAAIAAIPIYNGEVV